MLRLVQPVGEDLQALEARQDPRLLRALYMVAPGTSLREGVDNIIYARTGGLLVLGDPEEISFMFSGGLKLDVDYSPALLYQLAKMDGAIVLDPEARRINWANVQLMPDPTIHSIETGTRHRTAERVSKQTDALVISISQRRDVVSLYAGGVKYILQEIPTVLSKANQGLATLEKYRARLDRVSARLTALEFGGGATLQDVLTVLQRAELVLRTGAEVESYIIELGAEGRLIEMQLEETVIGVTSDRSALVRDYATDGSERVGELTVEALSGLPHQDLLDFGRLAELIGYDRKVSAQELEVTPRGYRVLGRIPRLPRLVAEKVVRSFDGLPAILDANEGELESVEGVGQARAGDIRDGLHRLQEVDSVDRYLPT
ncbi:MAG: DNA integrity scanning diadenylate cyclase DisA [Solirubrobacterales bacterium]